MTQFLPPNLLVLFQPRDPIPFLPPVCKLPHEKKTHGYSGVGQYLDLFEDPKDTPPPTKIETREERLERKKRERAERAAYIREQGIALWDPNNNPHATKDPYKTLFVARINTDTSESRLKKEFEAYGPVKKVMMIQDKISGKPKGYAFIEFENEKDMHSAYKHADGKKIEGRRVLVDVERGRTVKGWLPRRLGGGLGDVRVAARSGFRDERDERTYRERFDRREREKSWRSGSRDRERRDRRGRSREKERDRGSFRDRNHHDRDRHSVRTPMESRDHRHRYESKSRRDSDRHDSGFDGESRRHRSRERDRHHKRRSRSRSPQQDRAKRARYGMENTGSNGNSAGDHYHHRPFKYEPDSGEIEEGEDRSYDDYASSGKNNNYDSSAIGPYNNDN